MESPTCSQQLLLSPGHSSHPPGPWKCRPGGPFRPSFHWHHRIVIRRSLQTLSFSGNGYYLASGSRDGVVKLDSPETDFRPASSNIKQQSTNLWARCGWLWLVKAGCCSWFQSTLVVSIGSSQLLWGFGTCASQWICKHSRYRAAFRTQSWCLALLRLVQDGAPKIAKLPDEWLTMVYGRFYYGQWCLQTNL